MQSRNELLVYFAREKPLQVEHLGPQPQDRTLQRKSYLQACMAASWLSLQGYRVDQFQLSRQSFADQLAEQAVCMEGTF